MARGGIGAARERRAAISFGVSGYSWPPVRGKIKSVIRHVFPLEEAAEAHRAISGRHTTGKVVLVT